MADALVGGSSAPARSDNTIQYIFLGIGLLIIPIVLVAFMLSGHSTCAGPNPNGSECQQQPIDPTNPQIKQLQDSLSALTQPDQYLLAHSDSLTPLKQELLKLQAGLQSHDPAYATIPNPSNGTLILVTQMLSEISTIQTSPQTKQAKDALTQFDKDRNQLNQLVNAVNGAAIPPKGGFALPVNPQLIRGWNVTAHTGTLSHPQAGANSHGDILGKQRSGNCVNLNLNPPLPCDYGDASDIDMPAGTPVYAAFTGKVTASNTVHKNTTVLGYYLILQSLDGKDVAAYLHIDGSGRPAVGSTVQAGATVGSVYNMRGPHLHFELWINNKAVTATDQGDGEIGHDVWLNMAQALGFPNP